MAGFNSRDHIISNITNLGYQEMVHFTKNLTAGTAGTWQTTWLSAGIPGPSTGTPTTGQHTASTQGALWAPQRNDGATPTPRTLSRYLLSCGAVATQNCTLMVYDRLFVSSETTANTLAAGTKSYTMGALPRYNTQATSVLNEAWIELTAASTTAAATVSTFNYVAADTTAANAGATSTTSVPIAAIGSMFPIPLAVGKRGILPISSSVFTAVVAGTAAAGSHRMVILRPIARIPLIANVWNEVSFLDDVLGLPTIEPDPCLALTMLNSTSAATNVWGSMTWAFS